LKKKDAMPRAGRTTTPWEFAAFGQFWKPTRGGYNRKKLARPHDLEKVKNKEGA